MLYIILIILFIIIIIFIIIIMIMIIMIIIIIQTHAEDLPWCSTKPCQCGAHLAELQTCLAKKKWKDHCIFSEVIE